MTTFNEFASQHALNQQFATIVAEQLSQAIAKKGEATLVVSGGKTPQPFFMLLSQQPIAWQHVTITLADERWVDPQDDASNEKMVRQVLLQHHAAKATFVGLKNSEPTAELGRAITEARLAKLPRPFDVVILGMGDDGHTASLFPHAAHLSAALSLESHHLCASMMPLTAPHERMTLTLPALLSSEQIYLHCVGEGKKQVYQQAIAGNDVESMPIRAILQQSRVPVEVMWAP